jgi:hypothetical protein
MGIDTGGPDGEPLLLRRQASDDRIVSLEGEYTEPGTIPSVLVATKTIEEGRLCSLEVKKRRG